MFKGTNYIYKQTVRRNYRRPCIKQQQLTWISSTCLSHLLVKTVSPPLEKRGATVNANRGNMIY